VEFSLKSIAQPFHAAPRTLFSNAPARMSVEPVESGGWRAASALARRQSPPPAPSTDRNCLLPGIRALHAIQLAAGSFSSSTGEELPDCVLHARDNSKRGMPSHQEGRLLNSVNPIHEFPDSLLKAAFHTSITESARNSSASLFNLLGNFQRSSIDEAKGWFGSSLRWFDVIQITFRGAPWHISSRLSVPRFPVRGECHAG
jgi:hypothetical protein